MSEPLFDDAARYEIYLRETWPCSACGGRHSVHRDNVCPKLIEATRAEGDTNG